MKLIKENSTNQLNKKVIISSCPVTYTIEKIGGRWKALILYNLSSGTKRYNELKKAMPQISEKMLIQQLKELEKDLLVERKAMPVVPPHVEYSLTKTGKELKGVLKAMAEWGVKYNV
ncbi:MAG TPA: helix-turn-helix domain-containing protein [Cytophagaceae bacterium]|nr:helix-turn-helix domain-containing protein [Cytophagaceae bacterium]